MRISVDFHFVEHIMENIQALISSTEPGSTATVDVKVSILEKMINDFKVEEGIPEEVLMR